MIKINVNFYIFEQLFLQLLLRNKKMKRLIDNLLSQLPRIKDDKFQILCQFKILFIHIRKLFIQYSFEKVHFRFLLNKFL